MKQPNQLHEHNDGKVKSKQQLLERTTVALYLSIEKEMKTHK